MFILFKDKNGKSKNIQDVKYRDIKKLIDNEIHEGFYIDYKKEYNVKCGNTVAEKKAKTDLCDDICSFANNDGGWLIFGIEESENRRFIDCPIKKIKHLDYNQQISEILKNGNVFPIPNFETKFISSPNDRNKGYLLIYVLEGLYPPYVSNGKIKTRIGSSTQSVDIGDRKSLDALYEKKKSREKELLDFCKREIYYPPSYEDKFQTLYETPMINLYLKGYNANELHIYKEIEEVAQFFCHNSILNSYYYTSESIVFFNSDIDTSTTSTVTAELFFDFSFKIHYPLVQVSQEEKEYIVNSLPEKYKTKFNFDSYKFVNAKILFYCFFTILEAFNKLIIKKQINLSNYQIAINFEYTENSVLIDSNKNTLNFITTNGLKKCIKSHTFIKKLLKLYLDKNKNIDISSIIYEFIIMPFGFLPIDVQNYKLFTLANDDEN